MKAWGTGTTPFEALLVVIRMILPPPTELKPTLTASTAATGHRLTGGGEDSVVSGEVETERGWFVLD